MVQFGRELEASQNPLFRDKYLDYNALKHFLKKNAQARVLTADAEEEMFGHALDNEIDKVVLFYLTQQGEIADRLQKCRETLCHTSLTQTEVSELLNAYKAIAAEIIELTRFLEMNVIGLRKIIKKHDKLSSRPFGSRYLKLQSLNKYSRVTQLHKHEALYALVGALRQGMALSDHFLDQLPQDPYKESLFVTVSDLNSALDEISAIHERVEAGLQRTIHDYGAYTDLALEFRRVTDKESIGIESPLKSADQEFHVAVGLYINLLSTFLYMCNYYVCGPTSGEYAAVLGGTESLSGIIIGMTPWAALVSGLAFSYWSNFSFRTPLIVSAVFLLSGNLMYGTALQFNSLTLIIFGRLLNGFGGTRGLARRYIADNCSIQLRTQASAAFVTAGALGMACGPLIASLISVSKPKMLFQVSFLGRNHVLMDFNELTAPGWVMCFLWGVYLVLVILFFKEPPRSTHSTSSHTHDTESQLTVTHGHKHGYGAVPTSVNDAPKHHPTSFGISESDDYSHREENTGCCSCWKHLTTVIMLLLLYYFLDKLVTELITSSVPLLGKSNFQWSPAMIGYHMCLLGALVLPACIFVGRLSQVCDDRTMLLGLEVMTLVSLAFLVNTHFFPYTVQQYELSSTLAFVSLQALEGIMMSLLSKLVSPELAQGTWNSGLLATEAGTLGRALGDLFITLGGVSVGSDVGPLLNVLFVPACAGLVLMVLLTLKFYDSLKC